MSHRFRNFLSALVVFVLTSLATRNVEFVIDKHDWDKALDAASGAMPDALNAALIWFGLHGFWSGAFSVLVVWGCLEVFYVVQRWRRATALQAHAQAPRDLAEDAGGVFFDYSIDNGRVYLGRGDYAFTLRFTKASDTRIHLTKENTNLEWIARIKGARHGSAIDLSTVERSSNNYTLGLGEVFLAKNAAGYVLQGRIDSIDDDQRGAIRDGVAFNYKIMGDLLPSPDTALMAILV